MRRSPDAKADRRPMKTCSGPREKPECCQEWYIEKKNQQKVFDAIHQDTPRRHVFLIQVVLHKGVWHGGWVLGQGKG
jgi:hypothetical protein